MASRRILAKEKSGPNLSWGYTTGGTFSLGGYALYTFDRVGFFE